MLRQLIKRIKAGLINELSMFAIEHQILIKILSFDLVKTKVTALNESLHLQKPLKLKCSLVFVFLKLVLICNEIVSCPSHPKGQEEVF